jgi:NAD(P)-dependent dehydrogenase (short-subunit alcohol dehydrogenase family)
VTRTVVVTGAAGGIGTALVKRFAAEGDRVVALGRGADSLARVAQAEPVVCDVTDERSVSDAFAGIGGVDLLVNNAGIGESAPLHKTTLEAWTQHLEVNATGPFLCMRAVVPGMRERGYGVIVTVASIAGRVGTPYTAAYTASKHAAIGLTRAVAAELGGTGVRVNAVCPTFVRTEMTRRSIANIVRRTSRTPEQAELALTESSPLGRLLEPDEVVDAVVYLASPAAAAVNGQTLVLDGGGIQV